MNLASMFRAFKGEGPDPERWQYWRDNAHYFQVELGKANEQCRAANTQAKKAERERDKLQRFVETITIERYQVEAERLNGRVRVTKVESLLEQLLGAKDAYDELHDLADSIRKEAGPGERQSEQEPDEEVFCEIDAAEFEEARRDPAVKRLHESADAYLEKLEREGRSDSTPDPSKPVQESGVEAPTPSRPTTRKDPVTLLAFKDDPAIKDKLLERIGEHERRDAIIKGTYGELNGHFRGCAVGCSLHDWDTKEVINSNMHALYPERLGLPAWLAYLEDRIFESLPEKEATTWPRRFAEAIPVGADFSKLADELSIKRLERTLELKPNWPENIADQVSEAIEEVIAALRDGDEDRRNSAESAAGSAARSARSVARSAESVAESAARSARSAAWAAGSAARSARSAAWSAPWTAESAAQTARSAAESAAWSAELAALLDALKALPVPA